MEKALSVSQFNQIIKQIFDAEEMLANIKLYGEVSGFSVTRGVAYFSLKDENSSLPCVMFGAESRCASIKDGDQVVVIGSPNFYVKAGRFNFNCASIAPYGTGELFKKFLELKSKLEAEGLFDESIKKPIPHSVKNIGVVTSETGAVFHDIINVATRRNPSINIFLYPAKVQGNGAETEIATGINYFNDFDVDVVIVARGGGSLEDLQPFNTEVVARALYNCKKPTISAVGHETDFTICDFSADLRAPTPSAAAEIVVDDVTEKKQRFSGNVQKLRILLSNFIINRESAINVYKSKLQLLGEKRLTVADLTITKLTSNLGNLLNHFLDERYYCVNMQNNMLAKLNPYSVLQNGYAKVEAQGKVLLSINQFEEGKNFDLTLKDGKAQCLCVKKETI